MSTATDRENAMAVRRVTLVRYPGEDRQRMIRVVDGERQDHRDAALAWARAHYADDVPLAWLHHADKHLEPVSA